MEEWSPGGSVSASFSFHNKANLLKTYYLKTFIKKSSMSGFRRGFAVISVHFSTNSTQAVGTACVQKH